MIIQHNMAAANTNRMLGITNSSLQKSTEKLSSGYRINRAGDDAAGLSISEKMRGQIRGLNQASTNSQDGISLIQTAEGAMNEVHSILQRMRELFVQASNDTNADEDRVALRSEIEQLTSEIDRIANNTEFNTKVLLASQYSTSDQAIYLQVGANASQFMTFTIGDLRVSNGAASAMINLAAIASTIQDSGNSAPTISASIDVLDAAMNYVSSERSKLGAFQNRLEHTIANLDNTSENLQAAESRIRDVNMADQMVSYSKDTILQQAAQSMLAQANQQTQGVLALLQ